MKRGQAPALLGRYQLLKVLGKGAMGVVYEAHDPRLSRTVAIKTVLKSHLVDDGTASEFARRFEREAQAAARLNHPHIVTVFDFGAQDDVSYIVMEFIRGRELAQAFDSGETFTLAEAVRIMVELLDALAFAHDQSIVHRDVKPANVMLDGAGRVKLTDFGVARIADTVSDRTMPGTLVGTPSYMAPEQILGLAVGSRADLFAAGVILYQFLTGQRPFTGGGAFAVQRKIVTDPVLAPTLLNPALPARFDRVIERALAKEPEDRYDSAREFAADLQGALTEAMANALDLELLDDGSERASGRMLLPRQRQNTASDPTPWPAPAPAPTPAPAAAPSQSSLAGAAAAGSSRPAAPPATPPALLPAPRPALPPAAAPAAPPAAPMAAPPATPSLPLLRPGLAPTPAHTQARQASPAPTPAWTSTPKPADPSTLWPSKAAIDDDDATVVPRSVAPLAERAPSQPVAPRPVAQPAPDRRRLGWITGSAVIVLAVLAWWLSPSPRTVGSAARSPAEGAAASAVTPTSPPATDAAVPGPSTPRPVSTASPTASSATLPAPLPAPSPPTSPPGAAASSKVETSPVQQAPALPVTTPAADPPAARPQTAAASKAPTRRAEVPRPPAAATAEIDRQCSELLQRLQLGDSLTAEQTITYRRDCARR